MPRDLDIDIPSVLVEDDASRWRERVPPEKRRPKYVRNKLPTAPLGLSDQEKAEMAKILDPKRPGFIALIKSILR